MQWSRPSAFSIGSFRMPKRLLSAIIDPPGPFDTLETWERHFTLLKSLEPSVQRDEDIKRAEKMIARLKKKD